MNILIIGDPHFKVNNVVQCKDMSAQIIDIAKQRKPDMIVVLGDTLDRHDTIHMVPLCQSVDFLKKLQDISKVFLIIGNHDRKNNKVYLTEEHPFTALKYWNNIEVIDTVKYIEHQNHYFTFVPYVEPGLFKKALETVPYQNSSCIFCHQEFINAQMGAFKSVHGDEWDEDIYIISGHVHDYQKLQDNIWYVGTPIQHSFGDSPNKFIFLLTIKDKIKSHDDCIYEKIKLNIKPKKIIRLNYADVSKYKLDPDIEAKIIITGTLTEIKTLMKNTKILNWKKAGHIVVFTDIPSEIPVITEYQHRSFTSLLYDEIKTDNNLTLIYTELFGKK